jgi:hypothetical protein
MFKNKTLRTVSRLLITVTSVAMIFGSVPASIEARAATGAWTLTSEKMGIEVGYKNGVNYLSKDLITGDGNSVIKTSTKSSDGYQTRTFAYLGKGNGTVKFQESGGYIGPGDSHTSDNYSECSIPNSSYASGAIVTMKIHTWTANMVGNGMATMRVASIGPSDAGFSGSHGEGMKDANGKSQFDQNSTNPNTSKWFYPIKGEATITVTGTMPNDPREGDTCSIYYVTDGGQYEWKYTYKIPETKISKPGKAKISSVKNKKKQSFTVKYKGSGKVLGYQVQYSLNKNFKGAKTINATKTTTTVKKLKKGKTYYVRVRAYNLSAKNKTQYGKWSATKSVKIKK